LWIGATRESDRRFCRENYLHCVIGTFTILGLVFQYTA
jgi:hypothetical protein